GGRADRAPVRCRCLFGARVVARRQGRRPDPAVHRGSETGMTTPRLDRPDAAGRFGDYGGRFAPETLMGALTELAEAVAAAWEDPAFRSELDDWRTGYVGRPTPLHRAPRLSEELGVDVWLKREDLAHTGAHKINNAVGQVLLARRMGKRRIIAETG